MTGLVEDLLLLARLDNAGDGGPAVAREPVDLTRLVVDAVSDARVAGAGHRWALELPAEPLTVPGDADRLHQAVANLLGNARTHTPPGSTVTQPHAIDASTRRPSSKTGLAPYDSKPASTASTVSGPIRSSVARSSVARRFLRAWTERLTRVTCPWLPAAAS